MSKAKRARRSTVDRDTLLLIAERNIALRTALVELLRRSLGWRIVEADSTRPLLTLMDEERPTVVLSGLNLCDGAAMDVLRAARERHRYTPLLLMSGHWTKSLRRQASELGAFRLLQKPFSAEELEGALRAASTEATERD